MSDSLSVPDYTVPPPGVPRRPQTVDICITGRCNLQCRYCAYANEMTALSDLPTERWLAFFAEMGCMAVQRVVLTGGEPLTRPDLFELIDGLVDNRMRYSLSTNGTLVTERVIDAFRMGKRRLRLDSIQVSIDGSCADIHDASRPPASFERALRGLRMLKDAGFPVTVRVTINRYNVDDLENIARLLLEDIGLPAFSTNDVEQMGAALTDSASIALTPEQRRRVMEILPALSDRYGGRIVAKDGPLSLARDFKAITARLACGEAAMPGRGRLGACAYNRMAVLHDGTMVPCNLLPQLTMGTIGRMPLGKAWLHHPSINALRYRNQILMSTLPGCQGCSYTGFCMGGCPGAILAKFGRLNTSDPLACYRDYVDQDCNDVEQDCRFG